MNTINKRTLPDFISIGTQRAATTWLFDRLKKHPQVWMPEVKEVHFFDHIGPEHADVRRKKKKNDLSNLTKIYKFRFGYSKKLLKNIRWELNYFSRRDDFAWYSSIFESGRDFVTGEITPEYILLDEPMVKRIHEFNPHLKILITLRDPIDRTWSALTKFSLSPKQNKKTPLTQAEMLSFIRDPHTLGHSNYYNALQLWRSIFPAEQIHITYYDDIQLQPEKVLSEILTFIGVDPNFVFSEEQLYKKRSSSTRRMPNIPKNIEAEIAKLHIEGLEKLSQEFGGHTTKWLERAKSVIGE